MTKSKYKFTLLIDDNEIDNYINKQIIKTTNFSEEIIVHQSAQEGLEFLKSLLDKKADLPDIIFLDIMMPVMDGFEFLLEFEKLSGQIKDKCKVIMLSSSESFKDLNRANSNKFVYKFLNKPLSAAVLAAINL